jgi:hypothetical protein
MAAQWPNAASEKMWRAPQKQPLPLRRHTDLANLADHTHPRSDGLNIFGGEDWRRHRWRPVVLARTGTQDVTASKGDAAGAETTKRVAF